VAILVTDTLVTVAVWIILVLWALALLTTWATVLTTAHSAHGEVDQAQSWELRPGRSAIEVLNH
jgi:hypothetical protein